MQDIDQQQAQAILKDQGTRFLDYLAAVSRTFATRTPQRLEDSPVCIVSTQIPDLPNLITVGPVSGGHTWLTVKQPDKPKPVHVSSELEPYISRASIRKTTQTPKLNATYDALKRACSSHAENAHPVVQQIRTVRRIEQAFAVWKATEWSAWAAKTKPLEQAFDLYQKLFDLYLRLDKDADYFELLFGHCILTWSGRRMVDYPLVLTGAHMVFKESTGTILIEAITQSRMSVAPFTDTDLPGYELLARYQDAYNDHPVDVWDSQEMTALAREIVRKLGAAASVSDALDLAPRDEPVLQHGWCLLLRKRTDNTSTFYRGLAKKLQETDYLPEAFDAMFSDIGVVQAAVGGSFDGDTADRILMPLPANEDQVRIVKQLSRNSGVTVQGPPGTGKSHTIVNLISHLLAHGKRILVTAEKAQALAVLQHKMPQEIRDFAVASIGESIEDTEALRLSVQRMQDSLSDVDVQDARKSINQLNETIDQADARMASIDHELMRRLEHQMDRFETADGRKSAAEVAQWITANAKSNIIPDDIDPSAALPLDAHEFAEYVALTRKLSSEDVALSGKCLPCVDELPSASELAALNQRLDMLRSRVCELKQHGLDLHVVDTVPAEQVAASLQQLQPIYAQLDELDGEWERELGQCLRSNPQQRAWLGQGLAALQARIDQGIACHAKLLGHVITVPDGDFHGQKQLLAQWEERVRQGKGLPRVFNKELRSFGEVVRIDGHTPQTAEELDFVDTYLEQRQTLSVLPMLTDQAFQGLPIPTRDIEQVSSLPAMAGTVRRVAEINAWWNDQYPLASRCLRQYFPFKDAATDIGSLRQAIEVLEGSVARREEHKLQQQFDAWKELLASHTQPNDAEVWQRLLDAMNNRNYEAWQEAIDETKRLADVGLQAADADKLHDKLAGGAPRWADAIRDSHGDERIVGDIQSYALAWQLAQASTWLKDIATSSDVASLLVESREVSKRRQESILQVVSIATRLNLKESQDPDARKALNIWLDAMKRYGKGTGKNAANYLATARHALPKAMNAMPVWIMPLHKVMDNFNPAVSRLFDVIIVDESSQCDLLSVGVLALARKAVIVGDDKQTSPSNAFKSLDKIAALQNRYIPDIPGRSLLTFDDSLYSMSNRVFQSQIMLREHFRCVPEIIDYSNRFYDRQIVPLRERTHPEIGSPLKAVYVPNAQVERAGADVINYSEAQAIADQIRDCCNDPRYDGMTFGVVSLMSSEPHQKTISDRIIEAIGAEEYAKRRLRVGNPPAFQGDERNVIFLSFVTQQAGGRSYAATGTRDAQWMNVAASRAQDQLWAFYSMDTSELNPNDLRRGLIEYVRDYKPEETPENAMGAAETDFERDIVRELEHHGYGSMIHMHHRVGRYGIDCVVTVARGLSLAIECDGDEVRTPEELAKDIAKQRVLERLGWSFIRLSAPAYYLNPRQALSEVWRELNHLTEMKNSLPSVMQSNRTGTLSEPHTTEAVQSDFLERDGEHLPQPFNNVEDYTDFNPDDFLMDSTVEGSSSNRIDFGISHVALMDLDDLPRKGTKEYISSWVTSVVLALVSNEFPISSSAVFKRVTRLLVDSGYASSMQHHIQRSISSLKMEGQIFELPDGFYCPLPMDMPFRIVDGRSVGDISSYEVAAIMRIALLDMSHDEDASVVVYTGQKMNAVFARTCDVYRWDPSNASAHRRLINAYHILLDNNLVVDEGGLLLPSQQSLRYGRNVFGFLQKLKK